jgi:environmental stress-induced protein Ves
LKLIERSHYKKMPWQNGGGVTEEIDRFPSGDGPYLWRLSRATISADGPFSSFPGFERLLVVCSGEGIFLNDKKIEPLRPTRFSGDDPAYCKLVSSKVIDLGLIFDRKKVRAEMTFVQGHVDAPALETLLAFYLYDLDSGHTIKSATVLACEIQRGILISVWKS